MLCWVGSQRPRKASMSPLERLAKVTGTESTVAFGS